MAAEEKMRAGGLVLRQQAPLLIQTLNTFRSQLHDRRAPLFAVLPTPERTAAEPYLLSSPSALC